MSLNLARRTDRRRGRQAGSALVRGYEDAWENSRPQSAPDRRTDAGHSRERSAIFQTVLIGNLREVARILLSKCLFTPLSSGARTGMDEIVKARAM
jgi:hypothetical protein